MTGSKTRPYYGYKSAAAACSSCSWRGLGTGLRQGDMHSEHAEFNCPGCSETVFIVVYPTDAEIKAAAQAGDEEATAQLVSVEVADRRWEEVLETRHAGLNDVAELADGEVRCRLSLRGVDGENWYLLFGNDHELHRELAVWESTEPAQRLLELCREHFREQLVEFDYSEAFSFLAGDRLRSIGELEQLVGALRRPASR